MAVTLRGAAVVPAGNPTTGFTVAVPASVVAGDLLFLVVTSRDSVGAGTLAVTDNDAGGNAWAKIGNSTDHKATLWYKRATSGTAGKTVTVANAVGSSAGVLKAFAGGSSAGTPYTNVTVEANASGDVTAAGITPTNANSMLCASIHNYTNDNAVTNLASVNFGTMTATESLSTGGSDCGCIFGHDPAGSGATGNVTWSQVTAGASYSIVWAVAPEPFILTVGSGSYSLTGAAATPKVGRKVAVVAGSYALNGATVGLRATHTVPVGGGAYSLNGTVAGLLHASRLTVAAGSYPYSGADVTFAIGGAPVTQPPAFKWKLIRTTRFRGLTPRGSRGRVETRTRRVPLPSAYAPGSFVMEAGGGAYSIAGNVVRLDYSGDPGPVLRFRSAKRFNVYGLSRRPSRSRWVRGGNRRQVFIATAPRPYSLIIGGGAYSLVGSPVVFHKGAVPLAAGGGTYGLTGTAAGLRHASYAAGDGGSYSLTGAAVGLSHAAAVAAGTGSYSYTGSPAVLVPAPRLPAGGGAYTLTGAGAELRHTTAMPVETGNYVLVGADVTLAGPGARVLAVESGAYTLTGAGAGLLGAHLVAAAGGSYAYTGSAAGLVHAYNPLTATSGAYTLTGSAAGLVPVRRLPAGAGAYGLTGIPVALAFSGEAELPGTFLSGPCTLLPGLTGVLSTNPDV